MVEKLSRKGMGKEARTLLCFILLLIAFLTEVYDSRIDRTMNTLNSLKSRSLLADKNDLNMAAPMKDLFIYAILFKGFVSALAVGANYTSFSN